MMSASSPVLRGCGLRVMGGAYLEVPTSRVGRPIEDFLIDPPFVIDLSALGISAVGVKLIERQDGSGVTDVFDWVGSDSYPNVADFIEEVRRFGASRRISQMADFSKLSRGSRLILIHQRAWINDSAAYFTDRRPPCPQHRPDHEDEQWPPMCVGLYWDDVDGGYRLEDADEDDPREIFRAFPFSNPQIRYRARTRPAHVERVYYSQGLYTPAIFCALPVAQIAVINDPQQGKHVETYRRATQAALPVNLEDA